MKLLIWIILALGVTSIYDARKITKKYFYNKEENLIVKTIKIMGFIVCSVSGIILVII